MPYILSDCAEGLVLSSAAFHPKQVEFIRNSKAKYNLAHGSVRSGKTVCTLFCFLREVINCPGESIYIFGNSLGTIYQNVVQLLLTSPEFAAFRSCITWSKGTKQLYFTTKVIRCIGAGDEGALGVIQGSTIDLCYCDEMTLYPYNVIDMIQTRLSRDHSKLFASMNPKQPDHPLKKWIDKAESGDPLYYALHFRIDDNPYLPPSYIDDLKRSLSGLFYRRNYLGEWCIADGAIFDFFDRNLHVTSRGCSAEYYIAGLDVGSINPTALILLAVNTGRSTQMGPRLWACKEYYWDPAQTHRQKTHDELARDIEQFLQDVPVKQIYTDPSAAAFKFELRRKKMPVCDGDNDVLEGIRYMVSLMQKGVLSVSPECPNLIREIEGYVWDNGKNRRGEDAPLKVNDHICDALRYAVYTHKVPTYKPPVESYSPQYGQYRMGR